MAGHSKWNNIKRKKGKEDAKRAQVFTKLGRYIMVAAREGGPDPEFNPALQAAIDKAKAENMPNDNIDRAIKRGSGGTDGADFKEIVYEGYGPAGIAVIVNCLTDNRNRTAANIRHLFDKYNGNLGQTGSVTFMFDKKGIIGIERMDSIDEEELMMQAIDLGAEDFESSDFGFEITVDPSEFNIVKDGLAELGYSFVIAEISMEPQTMTELTDEMDLKNMENLIDGLESDDDVQEVYHNWDEPEE